MWKIPIIRLGAGLGGAVLLGSVALGIAGAAGGGNVAGDVLHTLHLSGSTDQGGPSGGDAHRADAATRTPERTPIAKVAADNPDGHCVMLPSTSDIVEHPGKHPRWHILRGGCPTRTPTPSATPRAHGATRTPTPSATPRAHGAATPTPTARAGEGHEGREPTEAAEPTEACPNPQASDPGRGAAHANATHSAFVKNCR